ncbi:MAG: histidine triad nucleotide-binding protein [Thermodesulfobacteriaceae bacterium]|nr:histidine triad nucleotide-binding protein [Thermodesulfobacteriaceae bacterium]MDW8136709.1 histidine triad nucleotide-binding protein [Thermodesulfobacterium sp.]
MGCIFCKIINREIPSKVVYEDERIIAFEDINPQAPYHILLVPKKHLATLLEISEEDKELIGHLFLIANQIAKDKGIAEKGFRVIVNCNEEGGQKIFHLHFHLLGGRRLSDAMG